MPYGEQFLITSNGMEKSVKDSEDCCFVNKHFNDNYDDDCFDFVRNHDLALAPGLDFDHAYGFDCDCDCDCDYDDDHFDDHHDDCYYDDHLDGSRDDDFENGSTLYAILCSLLDGLSEKKRTCPLGVF